MKIHVKSEVTLSITREYDISEDTLSEMGDTIESVWKECFDENMPPIDSWTEDQIREIAEYVADYEQIGEYVISEDFCSAKLIKGEE